jgi:hypothetical protein
MKLLVPYAAAQTLKGKGIRGIDSYLSYNYGHDRPMELEAGKLTPQQMVLVHKAVESLPDDQIARKTLRNMNHWAEALNGHGKTPVVSLEALPDAFLAYLKTVDGHRVYMRGSDDIWLAYVVIQSKYHPAKKDGDYYTPAYVELTMAHHENGKVKTRDMTFHREDLKGGRSAGAILEAHGIVPETAELREDYMRDLKRWQEIAPKTGLQCLAKGRSVKSTGSWYENGYNVLDNGQPVKVIVDEDSKDPMTSVAAPPVVDDKWYESAVSPEDDDEDDDAEGAVHEAELPFHPYIEVFDLVRDGFTNLHVENLEVYEYEVNIKDLLVLKAEDKYLIDLLVDDATVNFQDIIAGKSGGSIIMCKGPPGTGKTLSAEVYSEAMKRPLYSVQASQLGINLEHLERNLKEVLNRAVRWGAILLLDEADVYVHERGDDLEQNAVVGVFLRVLEYYSGVLFMTTNRGTLIDDAITSRCTAIISYEVPSVEDQAHIWTILAERSHIPLPKGVALEIAKANPKLSGRDVKGLLKLAEKDMKKRGEPISLKMIARLLPYRPKSEVQ